MARKIVVTSGKGGVGKTTVTANVGRMFADLGYRVVLIDVDFGLNNLDVVLGLESSVNYDMLDVFEGRCRLKQALIQDKKRKNLYVLPSGRIEAQSLITGQNVKLLIESLSKIFDFCIIDCPAGIDVGFHRALSCAEEVLVVTTPTLTSIRDADKVINIIKSYKLDKVGLVVNRARGDLILSNKMLYPLDIKEILKIPVIGVLPEEDSVFLSVGKELYKKCESYKAYKVMCKNILNDKNVIYDVTSKYSGFLGSIKRSIKNCL